MKEEDVNERNLDFANFPQANSCENRKGKDKIVFIEEEGDKEQGDRALQNKVIQLNAADAKTCNLKCKEGYYAKQRDARGDGNVANFKCRPVGDQTKRLGQSRNPLQCSSA